MIEGQEQGDVETRVERLAHGGDLGWVTAILSTQEDAILENWLDVVTMQPFHAGRRERAVADHIPQLYDALVAFLQHGAPREVDPGTPLDDAAILEAARQHASARLEQGLQPVDVVTEFRLLRQEILGSLRRFLPDEVPASDVVAAELLVNDALDGAISIGLRVLTDMIETVREDFLATTVHDVRQPLSLIKLAAQMTSRRLHQPEPNLERSIADLEQIEHAAARMETLLGTLIDASRIALNQLDLQPCAVDLGVVVRGAVERLAPESTSRCRLTIGAASDTTGAWDRARIERVVDNLLANAVKYSPAGSPIEVDVHSAAGVAGMVELCVRDHGMGIPEEELRRLFQRYARSRGAVESGIQGLGLGLYLCRGIVDAHGGRIWAESEGLDHGSAFHVLLPRAVPPSGGHKGEGNP